MSLQVGSRLHSETSTCEVIVIKGTAGDDVLTCAGAQMSATTAAAPAGDPETDAPTIELGKRYVDEQAEIEVLCTKRGAGPLTLSGRELTLKTAKALPASD